MYVTHAEYGVYGNGDGSTMDKVVCSDVVFETDESKEGGEVVDVYNVRTVRGEM